MDVPADEVLKRAYELDVKIGEMTRALEDARDRHTSAEQEDLAQAREALMYAQAIFDQSPDTQETRKQIDTMEELRDLLLDRALGMAGPTRSLIQGPFALEVRTRKNNTIVPWKFFDKFGKDLFFRVATIKQKDALQVVTTQVLQDVTDTVEEIKDVRVRYMGMGRRAE